MIFCTNCGKRASDGEMFCSACGTKLPLESQQPYANEPTIAQANIHQQQQWLSQQQMHQQQQMQHRQQGNKSRTAIIAALAAIALIAAALGIYLSMRSDGGNASKEAKTTGTAGTTDSANSTNSATGAGSSEPVMPTDEDDHQQQGSIRLRNIDTAMYPMIILDVETSDLETLDINDIKVYDGGREAIIGNIDQTSSSPTQSTYSVQAIVVETDEYVVMQNAKIALGSFESSLDYEVPYDREDAEITIHQIDTDNYPEVSVYFTIKNRYGEYVSVNDVRFFNLLDSRGGISADEIINNFRSSQDGSSINTALVIDRSGSMDANNNFAAAQDMALYFLDLLDLNGGDRAAIISFDNEVYMEHFFSSDGNGLRRAVRNMSTGGTTALYDALHVSLLETLGQKGSKCIIALTDGMDNASVLSPNTVINKAIELGIPIYIIGLGNEDFSGARRIAEQSGGRFMSISAISEIRAIYDDLFREQQNQMTITYEVSEANRDSSLNDLRLQFKSRDYLSDSHTQFSYQNIVNPNLSQDTISSKLYNMNDVERAIYYYQYHFVESVGSYDFNDLRDHLDPAGGLYETQRDLLDSYRARQVKVRLLYYKIDRITDLGGGSYEVVVTEQFYTQVGNSQASYKEFENTYIVRNTPNGHKVSELTNLITLEDRSVNIRL